MIRIILLLTLSLFSIGDAVSQSFRINSNGTGGGDWYHASSWSPNRIPVCGDTILIEAGDYIAINGQVNFGQCGLPMHITIAGTLDFASNGPKLRLPCGSTVTIEMGAWLLTSVSNSSGNNNLIDICGTVVWTAEDGDETGPIIWDSNPLPVELIAFQVEPQASSCKLKWSTASELNNDYFSIHSSTDLQHWELLERIPGRGNSSSIQSYSILDRNPHIGLSYYRLSQTDFNGSTEHFDPKSFEFSLGDELIMYPIPADRHVQMNMKGIDDFSISFTDSTGRVHMVHPQSLSENSLIIRTEDLPDGVYILRLASHTKTLEETLYILH